jgi:hypothetical protein
MNTTDRPEPGLPPLCRHRRGRTGQAPLLPWVVKATVRQGGLIVLTNHVARFAPSTAEMRAALNSEGCITVGKFQQVRQRANQRIRWAP